MQETVKFLLVDDLEENLISLEALLRRDGLELHTARSGADALELLLVNEYALAIVDVQMPGMDGFELAELMRGTERTRRIPIIFLTAGDSDDRRRLRGYQSGCVDILFKPVDPDILRGKAEVFIELYCQRQEVARQRDALRESEERLQLALQAGHTGVWEWNAKSGQVIWSHETHVIYGIPKSEFGSSFDAFEKLVHEDDRASMYAALEASLKHGAPFSTEFRIHRATDGQMRHVTNLGLVRRDEHGTPTSMVGTVTDVTEQREAEQALQLRERQLRSLSDNSPNLIARFDRQLRHLFVNASITKVTHLQPEQFIGKTNRELNMPPHLCDLWDGAIRRVFDSSTTEVLVFDYESPQGPRRLESHIVAEPTETGEVEHVLAVTRDVTVEWRVTEDLEHAKELAESANAAKDRFLAIVSHELRTPLSAILGYTGLISERVSDEEVERYLQIIRHNGDYLLEIINDILDLSKIEAGKFEIESEQIDPSMTIEDVKKIMEVRAAEKGLALQVRYDTPIPQSIVSDPKRLKQVLINLVGNAIKFTQEGRVEIRIRYVEDEQLQFDVIDTGIGMTKEQRERLFLPFSQGDSSVSRQFGGTGLGLAISQRLASLLGGKITCDSQFGKGSVFTLMVSTGVVDGIGMHDPAQRDQPVDEVAGPQQTLNCHVLVVDDRRDLRFLSKRILTKAGARVDEMIDGQKTIEYIAECMKHDQCPDLILLDMQMPILDGYATASQLRVLGYDGPIIALTADAMQGDRVRCIQSGCTDYLSKPIDAKRLIDLVSRHTSKEADQPLSDEAAGLTSV